VDVGDELLESGVAVVESMSEQHARDDVRRARHGQLSDVESTTALLSHFAQHLFHFRQDPRLHQALSESEPFHDGDAQLMLAPERRVVVAQSDACTADNNNELAK